MPSEKPPERRRAAPPRSTSSSSSSARDSGMPPSAASTRRWLRAVRAGWEAASSMTPTCVSGSREPGVREAVDGGVPGGGGDQSDERAQGGRLAGSVGTEEADDLALVDVEAQVVDGPHGAEVLGEVLNRDDGHVQVDHPERAPPPRACWPVSGGERRGTLPRTDGMKITLTGGSGLIGSKLVERLQRARRRRHHAVAPPQLPQRLPLAARAGAGARRGARRSRRRHPPGRRERRAALERRRQAPHPRARASSAPATWSPASRRPTRARACSSPRRRSATTARTATSGSTRTRRPATTSSPRCA